MSLVNDLRRDLREFVGQILEHGLAADANPVVENRLDEGKVQLSWSTSAALSLTFGRFASLFEYKTFLENREYNVALLDGSLFQLSYTVDGDRLCAHRLCFYPCPIDLSELDLSECSISEWIDTLGPKDWETRIRLRTPIRFDYDPKAASVYHPSVHLTVSQDTCRIPLTRPVSLGHFVRIVFEHFYPAHWENLAFLRTIKHRDWDSTLPEIEFNRPFVNWHRS